MLSKEEELCQMTAKRNLAVAEANRLRAAIRTHRDQRGDDRCFLDDATLYAALGEGEPAPQTALPAECDFLESCRRFWRQRQNPDDIPTTEAMTIGQLEREVERLRAALTEIAIHHEQAAKWAEFVRTYERSLPGRLALQMCETAKQALESQP